MSEWLSYFEDFPKENPANYVDGTFNPKLASAIRRREDRQRAADAEVNALISKGQRDAKSRLLLTTEICPQCFMEELNTYKIDDENYFCECHSCGIESKGETHKMALEFISDNIWYERLDIKQIIRD